MSIVFGVPFCGFKTIEGDVLIIDQDTPSDTLTKRLLSFAQALDSQPKHQLFVESMKGYSLSNGTLVSIIKEYSSVKLVAIDSLHTVCGKLNPNYTSDMSLWGRCKEHCLDGNSTIIVNHHISQKWELDINALMQGDTSRLPMGSSAITQQCDTYYIVGARADSGRTEKIYIRPVSRRTSIPLKPIVLRVFDKNGGETIEYEGFYDPELDEAEHDIITLFAEQPMERTVKDVYEAMGHKHGENKVRTALASLEVRGKLLMSRHKSNLFRYRLP